VASGISLDHYGSRLLLRVQQRSAGTSARGITARSLGTTLPVGGVTGDGAGKQCSAYEISTAK